MYELFYSPAACSRAVHVLLREIGVDFTLTKTDAREKDSRLLKANPRGQVPTLLVDGEPLVEGVAIMIYLAETHQSPLLPAAGMERARALQWLAFASATLHPLYGRYFSAKKKGDAEREAFVKSAFYSATLEAIQSAWNQIEAQLAKTAYIAGAAPTLGDLLLAVVAGWNPALPDKVILGEKTKAWLAAIHARPAFRAAVEAEQASNKEAA